MELPYGRLGPYISCLWQRDRREGAPQGKSSGCPRIGWPGAKAADRPLLVSLHPLQVPAGFTPYEHDHSMTEMSFVLSGRFHQQIGNNHIVQNAGSLVLLNPAARHKVWAEEGGVTVNILVQNQHMRQLLQPLTVQSQSYRRFVRERDALAGMYFAPSQVGFSLIEEMMAEECGRHPTGDFAMTGCLMRLLAHSDRWAHGFIQAKPAPVAVERAIRQYVEENYATVTLGELAETFHYSYRQMERLFRRVYGTPFPQAVNGLKLRAAESFIRQGYAPADAAERAGFANFAYYKRVLQKMDLGKA